MTSKERSKVGLFRNRSLRSSDKRYAKSTQFLVDIDEIPTDPQEAYDKARKLILAAGWRFKKRPGTTEHGRKFTMTLRKNIYLSGRWDSYDIVKKAVILWHELVHVRQRQRWGHSKFLARYATARGRWFIETPAYRMSIRVYERLSGGRFHAGNYIKGKLKSFRSSYKLGPINSKQYYSVTEDIWKLEVKSPKKK